METLNNKTGFVTRLLALPVVFWLTAASAGPSPDTVATPAVAASDNDLSLSWPAVTSDLYGAGQTVSGYHLYRGTTPDFIPAVENRIAQPGTASHVDNDALDAAESYFYRVTAVAADGTEALLPSPVAFKIRRAFTFDPSGSNTHWFTLPAGSGWSIASDIAAAVANVTHVSRWDAAAQAPETYDVVAASGPDFALQPGRAYALTISADTVLNLLGTSALDEQALSHTPGQFNQQWIGLPAPNAHADAASLAGSLDPGISKLAEYDPVLDSYRSWVKLNGTWLGENFGLTPGMAVLVSVNAAAVFQPQTGLPSTTASSSADQGYESISVDLDGTVDAPAGVATYQWDFEGDGIFDSSSSVSPAVQHTYTAYGTYHPTLLVTDANGQRAVAHTTLTLSSLGVDFSVDGFEPNSGGSADIGFTLPEDGVLSAYVYDSEGNLVKTLADAEARTAGAQNLNWDGTNDAAGTVTDGTYFVILQYTVDGVTSVFDTRSSSGGVDIIGSVTDIVIDGTLSPLTGDYVDISFTLPENALVTIRILDQEGTPIRTLLDAEPRRSGANTEVWDGTKDSGEIVSPGTAFNVDISTTSLPSNSLIATGGAPQLSNVTGVSVRFSPASNPYGTPDVAKSNAVIRFDLNKDADIGIAVFDANGQPVRSDSEPGLTAGTDREVTWNGRNDAGVLLAAGLYTVRIQAMDADSQVSTPFVVLTEIFY